MTTPAQAMPAEATEIGKLAVRATAAAAGGHPTTAVSPAHLVPVLVRHAVLAVRAECWPADVGAPVQGALRRHRVSTESRGHCG